MSVDLCCSKGFAQIVLHWYYVIMTRMIFCHAGDVKRNEIKIEQECILVGFIPSAAVAVCLEGVCLGGVCLGGVVCPGEYLPREVFTQVVCLPRGCLSRGVSARWGGLQGGLPSGGLPSEGLPKGAYTTPPVDRQTSVKTKPFHKYGCGW